MTEQPPKLVAGWTLLLAPVVALFLTQGGTQINWPLTTLGVFSFLAGSYLLVSLKSETEQTTLPTKTE